MAKRFAIFLFICVCVSVSWWPIFAQESAATPTVVSQEFDPTKLSNLQNIYFSLLEQYRAQEQKYIVAKNQYLQLNTLASQELAIKETRTLLSLRADALMVYIDILDEQLNQSKGIPLENKNPERINLSLIKEKVRVHKTKVESAQDRLTLDQESENFIPTFRELESHTYYTLSLIKVGYTQIAFDKLLSTRDAIKNYTDQQELSATKRSEKERGYEEIQRTIDSIDPVFSPIKNDIYTAPGNGSLAGYSQLSQRLNPVYAQINKVIQFLEEIRK